MTTNSTKASRATLSNTRNKHYSDNDIVEHIDENCLVGVAEMMRYDKEANTKSDIWLSKLEHKTNAESNEVADIFFSA